MTTDLEPAEMSIAIMAFHERAARLRALFIGLFLVVGIGIGVLLTFAYGAGDIGPPTDVSSTYLRRGTLGYLVLATLGSTLPGWLAFRLFLVRRAPYWIGELCHQHGLEPEELAARCMGFSDERRVARIALRWAGLILLGMFLAIALVFVLNCVFR